MLLRPESAGAISLRSPDPLQQPIIRQSFLQHDWEWKLLRAGIRMVREVVGQRALNAFTGSELVPGPECSNSDDDLNAFIRARALTTHHPLRTCAMGSSPEVGVVDAQLRVFGTERLRVVDASVIPEMVGGNINAAVIMIAEKIADQMRGRGARAAPLASVRESDSATNP